MALVSAGGAVRQWVCSPNPAHEPADLLFEKVLDALAEPLGEIRMGKLDRKHLDGLDDLHFQRVEPALEILLGTGARQMLT
jgi:hypothetical protein